MTKTFPIYIVAAAVALLSLILGLWDIPFWFIRSARTAAIVFAAAGFVMCSTGMIVAFVSKAPAHPLTIVGYLVGAFALFLGLVQVFGWRVPALSDPKTALILMGAAVVVKVVIARLAFLVTKA